MKPNIHPQYVVTQVTCTCGSTFTTRSTARNGEIHADVGPETARVTTLGVLPRGSVVNLERPLRADGRFGGHFVQGHVDAVGHIEDLRSEADFRWMTISFPPELVPESEAAPEEECPPAQATAAMRGARRKEGRIVESYASERRRRLMERGREREYNALALAISR